MAGVDKLLAPLGGRPLIARSVSAFLEHAGIDAVVVAVAASNRHPVESAVGDNAKLSFVLGGERRRDSVRAGLMALSDAEYVVVHDGARPLVTSELIDAALAGARESGAALCAIPVADTVKRADEAGYVRGTISRDGLWLAQTPQAFRRDLLLRAHEEVEADATDDAAMVELIGAPVKLVMGSRRNLKVTTPEDLALAEALLRAKP
jgi:2-C-methyl-D-erythritol 4-phosphate cytidylyltransferase